MSEEPSKKSKRVTGSLVLGALALILVPALFDFKEDQSGAPSVDTGELQIPLKYQSRIVPLDEAALIEPDFEDLSVELVGGDEKRLSSVNQIVGNQTDRGDIAPPRIEITQDDTAMLELHQVGVKGADLQERVGLVAWVVQLGSFSNPDRALKLRDQLRSNSWSAFTEKFREGEESRVRVRVGPELDKAKAKALRDTIAEQLNIDGMVLRYPSK